MLHVKNALDGGGYKDAGDMTGVPTTVPNCEVCGNTGEITEDFTCSRCNGAGYIKDTDV